MTPGSAVRITTDCPIGLGIDFSDFVFKHKGRVTVLYYNVPTFTVKNKLITNPKKILPNDTQVSQV